MKKIHFAVVVALAPILVFAADTPFFKNSYEWFTPGPNSKHLKVTIEEVDRSDKSSVVEVSGATAGSDMSSAFILNGMCDLAKVRRQHFFQAKQVLKDPLTFEVSFLTTGPTSAAPPVNAMAPNVFSVAYC